MVQKRHRIRQPLTPAQKRQRMARRRVARRYKKIDQPPTRNPRLLLMLVCLLVLAGVMYKFFGPESRQNDLVSSDASETHAAASTGRLDPEPLRDVIQNLEESLFTTRDASSLEDLGTTIALNATSFADRLRDDDDPRYRALAERISQLGRRAGQENLNLDILRSLRQEWVSARNSALKGAGWFRGGAVAIAEDAGVYAVYRSVASDLIQLAESARNEADYLAQEAQQGTDVSAGWREYLAGFQQDIRDVEWALPDERPRADSSAEFMAAVQKLETAIESVRRSISGAPPPSASFDIGSYEKAVATARDAFDQITELD